MQKQKEVSPNKVYKLPSFTIVDYRDLQIAVFADIASWILIKNEAQSNIFKSVVDGCSVQELIDLYKSNNSDLVYILTQIEAKQIETFKPKSIFSNKKLHLHLTNKCNLRCPHCYMQSGTSSDKELTTAEVFGLIKNFKSIAQGTSVDITGGEPTIHKDFFEIIEYANSLDLEVNVYTNGTTWSEDNVKRFSKLSKRNVQISIDGFNEESNSTIRGKGSFAKSIQAIDCFVNNKVHVKVAVTPSFELIKKYKTEYTAFLKGLIEKYGNDNISVNVSHELMQGRNLTGEQIDSFKNEYDKIATEITNKLIDDYENYGFVINVSGDLYDTCGFGGLNVTANGDFYFCDRIPDMKYSSGNIRDCDFVKISNMMKIAEQAGKIDSFKPCGDCEIRYICGGGCRVTQFKGFSDIKEVEHIDFAKIQPRTCSKENKERFYRLMVDNNERFYK